MNEIIERTIRTGKKGYIAFIDIKKDYDRLDRNCLFKVMENLVGIPEKFRNIIKSMHTNAKMKFIIGDIETNWVDCDRGVRQGCIMSPLLFNLYTEELIARVKNVNSGIQVGRDMICILMYVDDIVLFSVTATGMQSLLNAVGDYSKEFDVIFGHEKSNIIAINEVSPDAYEWFLNDTKLENVSEYRYLGVLLSSNGCSKGKNQRLFKAQQWYGQLYSATKFRHNKYEIVRELWKGVTVPGILYAMNVLPWILDEIQKLEVIQNKVGRVGLGANKYSAVESIRGDIGWSSLLERMMKGVLIFKKRLQDMNGGRWVKIVYRTFSQ